MTEKSYVHQSSIPRLSWNRGINKALPTNSDEMVHQRRDMRNQPVQYQTARKAPRIPSTPQPINWLREKPWQARIWTASRCHRTSGRTNDLMGCGKTDIQSKIPRKITFATSHTQKKLRPTPLEHTTHNGQNQQSECVFVTAVPHCNTHTGDAATHRNESRDGIVTSVCDAYIISASRTEVSTPVLQQSYIRYCFHAYMGNNNKCQEPQTRGHLRFCFISPYSFPRPARNMM